jgi:hypothetical protein
MPLKQITCVAMAVSLVCCAALFAQSDDPRKPDPYINKYVSMMLLSTIPDAPYVLAREITRTGKRIEAEPAFSGQRAADPKGLADKSTPLIQRIQQYRDSRGWVREDTFATQLAAEDPSFKPRMIMIYDADARKRYTGIFVSLTAEKPSWIMTAHPPHSYGPTDAILAGAGIAGAAANGPAGRGDDTYQMLTVSLGSDTMLGLHVEGVRQTGSRASTGDKFEIEGWFSPELQLPILVKSDDPRNGHVERRVTKLDRTEPDASLFVLPTDYQISQPKPVPPNPPDTPHPNFQ